MSKKEKKPKSKVRRILEWTGFGIIGVLFAFAMVAQIDAMVHKDENWGQQLRFGVGSFVVETNSMEPEYMVGSAIITYKKSADDIYKQWNTNPSGHIDITFSYQNYAYFVPDDKSLTNQTNRSVPRDLYGHAMTHRLREIHVDSTKATGQGRYIFIVAGINADSSWALNQYQAFDERYLLGTVVMNSNALGQVFKFIASPWGLFGLLLIPAFYLVISSMVDIFRALKEPEAAEASGGVAQIEDNDRERLKQEMLLQMLEEKKKAKQAKIEAEKPADSEEKPAESAPKEEKKDTLSGYDDEQKKALRQQMLAQIMAEKGKGKEAPAVEKKAEEKKESKSSLDGYDEEQKKALRQQMLAQIMAEKKASKAKEEAKEEPKPEKKEEDKSSLAGYSDEQKQALRQQMLAQIMAEKKAAKANKDVKKGDDNDGQA